MLVSVCICTYQRSHVVETIASVQAQVLAPGQSVEIVVVDDDPARSAEALVAPSIRYVHCGARNVAAARNAALDAAQGEWIAFIDDDEIAKPDWLAALLRVQQQTGADMVKGHVKGAYPADTAPWVRAADPFTRDYGADGETPSLLASGNILFRRALIEAHKLRFDPQFGRSGGEDSDFFGRLRQAGARAVAARSAVVLEIAPTERLTPSYLRARNRRAGQTDGRKAVQSGRRGAASRGARAALAFAWAYPLAQALHPRLGYRLFAKYWYARGVLEGVAGRADEEM